MHSEFDIVQLRELATGIQKGERTVPARQLLGGEQQTFTATEVRSQWRALLQQEKAKGEPHRAHLYVHSFLCVAKCRYCHCMSRAAADDADIEGLLNAIDAEAEAFEPIFCDVSFDATYFGGGTPSLFNEGQLEQLFRTVLGRFNVRKDVEHTIEFNPYTSSYEKLRHARNFGFNRVSFGVQTLTRPVLKRYGRGYQTTQMVRDAIAHAHEVGFPVINADILTLGGEEVDGWRDTVRTVLEMEPSTLKVNFYRPEEYFDVSGNGRGSDNESLPQLDRFVVYDVFREECEKQGYRAPPAPTPETFVIIAKKRFSRLPFRGSAYNQAPQDGHSILGLGPFADSQCGDRLFYYNHTGTEAGAGFEPRYVGRRLMPQSSSRLYMIHHADDLRPVGRRSFKKRFGCDPVDAFPNEIAFLVHEGLVRRHRTKLEWLASSRQDIMVTALVLAGPDAIRQAVQSEADATSADESAPEVAGGDTEWTAWLFKVLPTSELGGTDWRVAGPPDEAGDFLLEAADSRTLRIRLERTVEGEPALLTSHGLSLSYLASELPEDAMPALKALFEHVLGAR